MPTTVILSPIYTYRRFIHKRSICICIMDLEALSNRDKVSLLTLPCSDLLTRPSPGSSQGEERLQLLQLPAGWTPLDLKDAYFLANKNKAGPQEVALIAESKKCSFIVHKVETSNVLVLVPPRDSLDSNTTGRTSNKRIKITEQGKTLISTQARLLTLGGSGASFWEVRPHSVSAQQVAHLLPEYNPYHHRHHHHRHTTSGQQQDEDARTIDWLAQELQVSRHEIQQHLQTIQAYVLPKSSNSHHDSSYCRLSEQACLEGIESILATLCEVTEHSDYAGQGIHLDTLVQHVLDRMSDEERFHQDDHVVRHLIQTLSRNEQHYSGTFQLDVNKVAKCVARQLFQRQTAPWEETLLLSRWQAEMPGIGNLYQVDTTMLRGLAVDLVVPEDRNNLNSNHRNQEEEEESKERYWKYLPVDSLPAEPEAAMTMLFADKHTWTLEELQPYLYRLGDIDTQTAMLLRFTKIETKNIGNDTPIKVYTSKI